MPEIDVRDTRLFYEEAGAGEPLVLLHGGLGTAGLHWHRELPFFARSFRVIAPDLRGYGRSSPPREFPPDFYHRDAADVAALIEALAIAPARVMGWSDGGIVGLVLAATRPDLVRRLVVVGGEESLLPKERAAWAALVDTSSWSERALERFKQAQGPLNWPGIFERMLTGYNAVLDAGGEIIGDRLHEIRCPVLVIHGDADPVVPVEHPHVLRERIANAEVHIWPGVGHLPHREREPEFQRLTLEFLTRP